MCDVPSWIQAISAVILVFATIAAFIVLLGYAADTRKMAVAAIAQAEAVHMPCLTLRAMQRDFEAALLDENAKTDMVLFPMGGQLAIENYGTGPAINVEYVFRQIPIGNRVDLDGYLPYLAQDKTFATKMPRNSVQGHEYELTISYASVSGQKYRTNVTIKNCALVEYKFSKV
jgi:hypothetical protein